MQSANSDGHGDRGGIADEEKNVLKCMLKDLTRSSLMIGSRVTRRVDGFDGLCKLDEIFDQISANHQEIYLKFVKYKKKLQEKI